jgi:SAC3/GANP family
VSHALSVRQSVQLENYHKFFQLCRVTPNLGNHILDLMTDNKRLLALQKVVRSYKPSIPASFVSSFLNFDSEEEGKAFMIKAGCVLEESTEVNCLGISMTQLGINTKDSVVDTSIILHQDKLLL